MTSTYTQLPGTLNLFFRQSDQFGAQVAFDVGLTGSTVTSSVVTASTGAPVVSFATSVTDAVAGKVNISLTESQTSALAVGTYNWRMVVNQPGDVQRTFLTGVVEVRP